MVFFLGILAMVGAVLLGAKIEEKNIPKLKAMRFGRLLLAAVVLAYFVWGVCVGSLLGNIATNVIELVSPQKKPDVDGFGALMNMLMAGSGLGGGRLTEGLSLLFNLWALLGAAGLLVLRLNPWSWGRWLRVSLAGVFGGLLLGRPFVGWLSWAGMLLPDHGVLVVLTYTIAPPLVLLLAGGWSLQFVIELMGWQVLEIFAFWVVLPVVLFNQILQFDNTLKTYRQQQTGLVGYIVRLGYWLRREPLPETPDDSKGARFATGPEVQNLCCAGGDAFGHVNGGPLCLANEKHTMIMASTRSGKGVSLIIPHLLRYKGSAFVLDPKGENAKATGRRRKELNDTVCYLDPFGISGKPQSRFNPLSRFTPENMEAESKALAAALTMGDFGKRDHWTASAQQLLAALILYVYASPTYPPHKKDLGTVRRVLLGSWGLTLKEMEKASTLADGLVSDLAVSFLKTPEKELGSIVSTAQRETEILDNPFILKCLSASGDGNEVDFKAWNNSTMTVFLCLSAPKFPVFSRWLRLVLTSALDEMTDTLNPPSLPVCFMLDELATLGHLQAVENAVGLAAGYGVQLWTVFQDVAQMKDLYKGRWASFIGNAGVRAVFSLQDYETAKYWSDFLGHKVVETHSQSQNIYGITHGQNVGETLRPLLSPEEIMMLLANKRRANGHLPEPENMLVLAQGSCPLITKRVAYFDDPALRGLWDDPRGPAASTSYKTTAGAQTKAKEKTAPRPQPQPEKMTRQEAFKKYLGVFLSQGGQIERNDKKGKIKVIFEGREQYFSGDDDFATWLLQLYNWRP